MSIQSAQVITVLFTTRRFDTGSGTNADSTPTGTLYLNGVSNAASVTVTNISAGLYKASVTLPTLAIGDICDLSMAATVNSVSDKATIWRDTKDFAADASGFVTANLNGDLTTAMKTSVTTAATAATPTAAAVTGNVGGNVTGSVGSVTGLTASNLDVAVSSRLASASYTAPDNSDITAIKAKTDNLPAAPADESLIIAATSAITSQISGLHNISTSDVTTACTASTPNLNAAYDAAKTAASATTAAAIKAKTDSLTFTNANQINANIHAVNDVNVGGAGTAGSPFGPA